MTADVGAAEAVRQARASAEVTDRLCAEARAAVAALVAMAPTFSAQQHDKLRLLMGTQR